MTKNIIIILKLISLFIIVGIFMLFVSVHSLRTSSNAQKDYYKGAVVEYSPITWNGFESIETLILKNAKRYIKIIDEASKENTDIIVFPECGLTTIEIPTVREKLIPVTTVIPNVEDESVPCNQAKGKLAEHLYELSCAAKAHKIYVVVNMDEKEHCDTSEKGCPTDGWKMYNTNIVFDREGKIIAKYRKFNLFTEPEINITSTVQLTTFDTDFGVTFGMFICFDILFHEPSITIVKEKNINNVVYSTAWFSELPMLTAIQTQAGYSYSLNVNLLASGYSRPEFTNCGSGIYAGEQGPLVMIMPEQAVTKLLIAEVPIKPKYKLQKLKCNNNNNNNQCTTPNTKIVDIKFDEDYSDKKVGITLFKEDLSKFTTKILEETDDIKDDSILISSGANNDITNIKQSSFKYTKDELDCDIKVKWQKNAESQELGPYYRMIGYSGLRSFSSGVLDEKIEVCSVIACKNKDLSSCGLRPTFDMENLTNITSILINMKTTHLSNPYVMTLDKNLFALSGDKVSFMKDIDKKTGIQSSIMVLEKPCNDLLSFGFHKVKKNL